MLATVRVQIYSLVKPLSRLPRYRWEKLLLDSVDIISESCLPSPSIVFPIELDSFLALPTLGRLLQAEGKRIDGPLSADGFIRQDIALALAHELKGRWRQRGLFMNLSPGCGLRRRILGVNAARDHCPAMPRRLVSNWPVVPNIPKSPSRKQIGEVQCGRSLCEGEASQVGRKI